MKKPFASFSYAAYPKGSVTQFFGESKDLYKTVCAAPGYCLTGGHNGVDLVDAWGTPLFAVMGGVVCDVKNAAVGYGKHIRILSDIGEKYLEWTYGHMSRIDVTLGQRVNEGDPIGLMGNTGFVVSGSTPFWKYNPYAGTHLHLGVRQLGKTLPGQSHTISYPSGHQGNMENYNNGFLGSIDPYPFFNDVPPAFPAPTSLTQQSLINQIKQLYAKLKSA